jgi:hypothetical protein
MIPLAGKEVWRRRKRECDFASSLFSFDRILMPMPDMVIIIPRIAIPDIVSPNMSQLAMAAVGGASVMNN